MKSDVAQVSAFADFENFGEIQRKQFSAFRRRRYVGFVVAAKRVFDSDVAGDLLDFVESAFDWISERSFCRDDRCWWRRWRRTWTFVADVRTLVTGGKYRPEI